MKKYLLAIALLLAGCAGVSRIHYARTFPDGSETSVTLYQPKIPKEGAGLEITTNGAIRVFTAGRQSKAEEKKVGEDGKTARLPYYLFGVIAILGVLGYAAPNYLVSNLEATFVLTIGGSGMVSLKFLDGVLPVLKWVAPIAVVVAIVWLVYRIVDGKHKAAKAGLAIIQASADNHSSTKQT